MRALRYGFRRLRASPVFSLFAVVTLALGIGVTATVYSLVRSILGAPAGVLNPARIVTITGPNSRPASGGLSWADYQDLRARQSTLDHVAAWSRFRSTFAANGQSGAAFSEIVSGDYFSVFGITPLRGRLIEPQDDRAGAPLVAVLNHVTAVRIFGSVDEAVGRPIKVNGVVSVVIGVTPPEFVGVANYGVTTTAVWVPLSSAPSLGVVGASLDSRNRTARWLLVSGLMRSARDLPAVAADVSRIGRQLDSDTPITRDADPSRGRIERRWTTTPLAEASSLFESRVIASALLTAVGIVLLVACSNLASLLLARGAGRSHERAVRLALGASRGHLVRDALTESVLLGAAGGIASIGVTRALTSWLTIDFPIAGVPASFHLAPRVDTAVLIVVVEATLLAIAVAGVGPAFQSRRVDLRGTVTGNGGAVALPRWRGRRRLLVSQVVGSVILLAISAVSLGQLRLQAATAPGFDIQHIAVAQVDFEAQHYDDGRVRNIAPAILERLRGSSGVLSAMVSSGLPVGMTGRYGDVARADGTSGRSAMVISASPSIFGTLDIPIARGRGLSEGTDPAGATAVVLSELTARNVFGSTDVIGKDIRLTVLQRGDVVVSTMTIVGVAADTDVGRIGHHTDGLIYTPLDRGSNGRLAFVVRMSEDPHLALPILRQTIASVDSELAVSSVDVGLDVGGSTSQFFQITAAIAGVLGLLALTLALAGLFGVLSHLVTLRTREIGVRMALGASRADVSRMVIGEGVAPVFVGLVSGLVLSGLIRLTLPLLQRVVPTVDLPALALIPAIFLTAAVIACYVPARRAASVDPMVALKDL
jgi:putative ABC transport system permease protein